MSIPKSEFRMSTNQGYVPLDVSFYNLTTGQYVSAQWDFGDGKLSNEINPTHRYAQAGTFVVTLKTFGPDGSSSIYQQTLVALPKSNITSGTSSTPDQIQQPLQVFKRLEPGQVSVRPQLLTGSTFSSNVPITSAGTVNFSVAYSAALALASASGGKQLTYSSTSVSAGFAPFIANASGNAIMALVMSPSGKSSTDAYKLEELFASSTGMPILFYRVVSAFTGASTIYVDRPVPYIKGNGSNTLIIAYFIGNSGATYTFGQQNALGSNMNLIAANTYAGKYGSTSVSNRFILDGIPWFDREAATRRGTAVYFGYDTTLTGASSAGVPLTFLYTEHSAATTVEKWYPGTVKIILPWVLWHESTTAGLTLYDVADQTTKDEATGLSYRYLRIGSSQSDTIVGKVFYDKKLILITDPELCSILIYTSNRNWTYPAPRLSFISSKDTSKAWVETGITYYYTYRVRETNHISMDGSNDSRWGMSPSGLSPFPCSYIASVNTAVWTDGTPNPGASGYLKLTIPQLKWFTGGTGCLASGKYGPVADVIELFAATGYTTEGPALNSWRLITGSPAEAVYSGGQYLTDYTIDITKTSTFQYGSGVSHSFSASTISGTSSMYPGAEPCAFAYISGQYATTLFKLSVVCVGKANEFNSTQNETFSTTLPSPDNAYITEVGLYNENNELLVTGKLSKPLRKSSSDFVTVKLEIDI